MLQSLPKKYPNRLQLFRRVQQPDCCYSRWQRDSLKKKKKLSLDGAILVIQDLYARMSVGTGPEEKTKAERREAYYQASQENKSAKNKKKK
jgi:hypothetical protein